MRVFLSWSGDMSKGVATRLKDWLPYVVPAVRPWMSSHDIQAGALWEHELAKSLANTDIAILVMTRHNQGAPWLLYEAGVLSAHAALKRVVPYRVDLPLSELAAPITRFQSVDANEDGTKRLVDSLNLALPPRERVGPERFATYFSMFWPRLQAALTAAQGVAARAGVRRRPAEDYLEEILELLRSTRSAAAPPPTQQSSIDAALHGLVTEIGSLQGKVDSMEAYERGGGGGAGQPWWEPYVERHRTALSLYVQALALVERARRVPLQD